MNNQSESDLRKSKRQRVPNSFYMQAIAELKRPTVKNTKQTTTKPLNKKQPIFHESSQNSQPEQYLEEANNVVVDQDREWYTCRMPKTGQFLNVQFIMERQQESIVLKKKQEIPKINKKAETSFDLLSLFQEAIKNVNEQIIDKPSENQSIQKQVPIKSQQPTKKIRKKDSQGVITSVRSEAGRVVFYQSVLGQVQVELIQNEVTQEIDHSLIQELKEKIQSTRVFAQLPVFESED